MRKLIFTIIVTLWATNSFGLPSLRLDIQPGIQPSQKANSVAKREGVYRKYYDDGTLKSELSFKNDLLDGRCRTFYKRGSLKKQVNYHEGVVDGKAFEFYENGQYKIESRYTNGKVNGVSKLFYDNGNLYSYMVYKEGRLTKNFILDRKGRAIQR